MLYEDLKLEVNDNIALITLNRPEKKNAMSPRMIEEIVQLLEELRYRKDVRVLVFTGAGASFCAGADLKLFFHDLKLNDPDEYDRIYRLLTEWRGRTLYHYPKPTIAMVNGWCFGGGFPIVEGCDIAVAADDAIFGLSEINFGLFPGGTASKSVSRIMRPKDAMYYALTGDTFDGKRAAEMGFVNFSVPRAQLEEKTMEIARKIAGKSPAALHATKDGQRYSLLIPSWDAAINYSLAKENELTLLTKGAWVNEMIPDFVEGKKFRPGLGGHEDAAENK